LKFFDFIEGKGEIETILYFSYEICRLDPDCVLTTGGDQFLFLHLFNKTGDNEIEFQLLIYINREQVRLSKKQVPISTGIQEFTR